MSTLRILGDAHIRWLNLSGSGNETAAHVRASNRMTLMFCAFEGNPMILRVYGQATTSHPRDADWEEKATDFPTLAGSRQRFPSLPVSSRAADVSRQPSHQSRPVSESVHRQREGGTARGRSAQSPRTAPESAGGHHAGNP